MRSIVCGIGFALASSAAVAAAQTAPDFSALRARVGDEIVVTTGEGVEVGGRVTKISPSALSIDGYAFTPAEAIKIERPGDSIWNGFAIGYGVGALFGLTIGAEGCLHGQSWRCVNEGGITYGLLGALIDFAHKGRRKIYESPSAAPRKAVKLVPDVGPDRKGVAVALAF
jgi:hypothetical protein